MPSIAAATDQTLGGALQRRRREVRAYRVEQVVAALEERVHIREATGFVPPALRLAIRDFQAELAELRSDGTPAPR